MKLQKKVKINNLALRVTMIQNQYLEAGCIFYKEADEEAHLSQRGASGTIGMINHAHTNIALSHRESRNSGVEDGDAGILLEQLRFANIVLNMIDIDKENRDFKCLLSKLAGETKVFVQNILQGNGTILVRQRRSLLELLKDFDRFASKNNPLIDQKMGEIEEVLSLQEAFDQRGIFGRLARLYRAPESSDTISQRKLEFLLMGYLAPVFSGAQKIADINSRLKEKANGKYAWKNFPSSLAPDALDQWLRGQERELLVFSKQGPPPPAPEGELQSGRG